MSGSTLRIETDCGVIDLHLREDAAPLTVRHVRETVESGLYNKGDCCFYPSDFVIQCGLEGTGRTGGKKLALNETKHGHCFISNTRGTASMAHHDVPDNGSTEFFINLKDNSHLDEACGGYCVFGEVKNPDSFETVDKIAAAIPKGTKPKISKMSVIVSE